MPYVDAGYMGQCAESLRREHELYVEVLRRQLSVEPRFAGSKPRQLIEPCLGYPGVWRQQSPGRCPTETIPDNAHFVVQIAKRTSQHEEQSAPSIRSLDYTLKAWPLEEIAKDGVYLDGVLLPE